MIDKMVVKKYVSHICVADEFNAERFEKIYGIRPTIVPYGIDYEFFSKGNGKRARKIFNLDEKDFVLLQVGMLTPLKNQLESIKVVRNLENRIPNIKLILAGYGEEEYVKILKNYVQDFRLERHVIFTGHLARTIVRDLYAACDVCLFPVKSQGGWLSPFEALCAGKPIVVSTQMTAADIINKNKIGIVTDDFTRVVLDMYNNPAKYRRMAMRGKMWVKENLNWNNFCQRMLEIFERVREN
jgi:1,2-diacylglycerol 3-alpha-glucosyltransferase